MGVVKMMNCDLYTQSSQPSWTKFDALFLHSLRVQMMGSLVTCKLAMDQGWAINIGGGFGHHTANAGGGLAVYDDVLLCLSILTTLLNASQILIINLDAYQSPCYKHVKKIDCPVTIIDLYSDPTDDEHDCTVINSYAVHHTTDIRVSLVISFIIDVIWSAVL
ncbi:uncharacterized protein [Dysidea avara]|uniref:uncharacterized protein isoform X2 n=1 Tax=Dysidea avara TaxID=196820 RepID=UPI00331F35D6